MTTGSIVTRRLVLVLWAVACCLVCIGAARPPHPFTDQPESSPDPATRWTQRITVGMDVELWLTFNVNNDSSGKLTGQMMSLDGNNILATLTGKVSRAGKFSAKVTSLDARVAPLGKKIMVSGQWERLSQPQIYVRMADKQMQFFSISTIFGINT